MRSRLPALISAFSTIARFWGRLYCISARCIAFSSGSRGTYTGDMSLGSIPVKNIAVESVPGVG